ncbi:MAG: hypothetical protein Q8M09_05940 [Pseudomonadota bacterium]|nr:hypothetical protein [Pseudomonadota bacterium]MDP1903771.1 hypothetical protein [Pseudomonadota bacterium]MDP2353712.1 hypothetical protein [Pseudomonadota bacterium]
MLKRHYFYSAIDPATGRVAQGIATVRTWRADPQRAFDAAGRVAADELAVAPELPLFEVFNRV